MRRASRWNAPHYSLVRALRRLEILCSPVLGAISLVLGLLVGWLLLVALVALVALALPVAFVVQRVRIGDHRAAWRHRRIAAALLRDPENYGRKTVATGAER